MPHVTLEYSNNLAGPVDIKAALRRLHDTLGDLGMFKAEDIKSRAMAHDQFYIGDGNPESVFVHLTVGIFAGRSEAEKLRISDATLVLLQELFAKTFVERPCDITVEIRELEKASYGKAVRNRTTGRRQV